MDPDATLKAMQTLMKELCTHDNLVRMAELTIALRDWLESGGFEPDWDACPEATTHYQIYADIADEDLRQLNAA